MVFKKRISTQHWTAVVITTIGVSLSAVGTFNIDSFNTIQLLGITFTLFSTLSYGSNYIVSEAIILSVYPPPGPVIQLFSGITGFVLVLVYIMLYTIPNWENLVTANIQKSSGSVVIIILTYIVLIFSSCIHSWSYLKLLKQTGSVSTGILQSLRASCVFFLSSLFFCTHHPEQCINPPKIASALIVIFGVTYFSYLSKTEVKPPTQKEKNQTIHV